jgi:hypothetical protein
MPVWAARPATIPSTPAVPSPAQSLPAVLRLLAELVRVVSVASRIDRARTSEGPTPLVAKLRAEGRTCAQRGPAARQRLQRAVRIIDARFPGGGNCYRRVLIEMALDAGAARQPVCFGLRAGGGVGSGHAYFAGDQSGRDEAAAQKFDVVFEI